MAIKVTGPQAGPPGGPEAGQGPDPAGKTGKTGKVDKAGAPGAERPDKAGGAPAARSFAETLATGGAAGGNVRHGGAAPVARLDPVTSDIAAELQAGKVDARTAVDRVVERVLDRQLGANAPVALRDQVREVLRDAIGGDPLLAERLRGLT